jgi:hypothetical protein
MPFCTATARASPGEIYMSALESFAWRIFATLDNTDRAFCSAWLKRLRKGRQRLSHDWLTVIGNPSTSASSWAHARPTLALPGAGNMNLP